MGQSTSTDNALATGGSNDKTVIDPPWETHANSTEEYEENLKRKVTVSTVENGLMVTEFRTIFRVQMLPQNGVAQDLPIIASDKFHNSYDALFPADDQDFQIQVDNSACKNRNVKIEITCHNQSRSFSVVEGKIRHLRTLRFGGGKFHLLRQSVFDGKYYVQEYATKHGMSEEEASISISEIKFRIFYSKPSFNISAKLFNGKIYEITAHETDTIEDVKRKLLELDGGQTICLTYNGQNLENGKMLCEYNIEESCTVLMRRNVPCQPAGRDFFGVGIIGSPHFAGGIFERGAIVFSGIAGQKCSPVRFNSDQTFNVQGFTISLTIIPGLQKFHLL